MGSRASPRALLPADMPTTMVKDCILGSILDMRWVMAAHGVHVSARGSLQSTLEGAYEGRRFSRLRRLRAPPSGASATAPRRRAHLLL